MSGQIYLIKRLLDGISGWLTFQQAAGHKTLYCEHFLYPPVHDVVKGRLWTVHAQERLNRGIGSKGASRTIDFIFYRNTDSEYKPGVAFIEIKYLRTDNKSSQLREIAEDLKKLRKTETTDVESRASLASCGKLQKFLLVVGQDAAFRSLANTNSTKYPEIVAMLKAALGRKLPKSIYRSHVETKLKQEFHWHAVAFGAGAWPDA